MVSEDDVVYWPSYAVSLGQRIRALRRMRNLTQERLSQLAGIHRNVVVSLEGGISTHKKATDPLLSTMYKLARALHVPVSVVVPDGTRVLQRVCSQAAGAPSPIDFVWPAEPSDVLAFDGSHLYTDDAPRFVEADSPLNERHSGEIESLLASLNRKRATVGHSSGERTVRARQLQTGTTGT